MRLRRHSISPLFLISSLFTFASIAHAASDVELVVIGDTGRWDRRFVTVEREIHSLLNDDDSGAGVSVHHHVLSSAMRFEQLRSELRKLGKSRPNAIWVAFDPFSSRELGVSKVIAAQDTSELTREITDDLRSFQEVAPLPSVSVLADKNFIRGLPNLNKELKLIRRELGVPIRVESFPRRGVQAVYFSPLFCIPHERAIALIQDLNNKKVRTFSSHAAGLARDGVLGGRVNDPEDPSDIRQARRVALEVQHLLTGTPLATSLSRPIEYPLAINRDTARLIGVDLRFDVLRNATLLASAEQAGISGETLDSPREIVKEAIQGNLNLAASRFGTESAQNAVGVARSSLFPKIDGGLAYLRANSNLSQGTLGLIPEHTSVGYGVVTQNLFVEPVLANLSVSGHQAEASREDTRQLELDITQGALNGYAQLLLVRQQLRQQENNIARTQSNLATARAKLTAGAGNQSDVLRWESELDRDQSALQNLQASAKIAEIALNRVLHRPLERAVTLQELSLDHAEFWVSNAQVRDRFNTARKFTTLETFLVSESLKNSPELKSLDEQVTAVERGVLSDKAKFVLPTLSANALVAHTITSDATGVVGPPPGLPNTLSTSGETNWAVAGILTYNIFNGLGDKAKLDQDAQKLHQLETTRSSRREQIEQDLRQSIEQTRAAYNSIALEQASAKAADENYDLMRRAYVRGARSITELIDAQNAAFNSEVAASTSVYTFFQAYFNMEHAIGKFDVMQSESERRDFESQLTQLEKM